MQLNNKYSPGKYATSEYEENADDDMEPEICGTRFGNAIIPGYSLEDDSSDSVPDEWDSQYGPDVRQKKRDEENSHLGEMVTGLGKGSSALGDAGGRWCSVGT